jgi:hypothetical protein
MRTHWQPTAPRRSMIGTAMIAAMVMMATLVAAGIVYGLLGQPSLASILFFDIHL